MTESHTGHTEIISTNGLRQTDRFSFWRDVICDAYLPIHCDTPEPADFEGHIGLNRFSKLHLSRINGSEQIVSRNHSNIGRSSTAYFMLSLQMTGTSQVSQMGRNAHLRMNDIALYSTIEPYQIHCLNAVDQLILQIPRADLLARMPLADLLTATQVDGQSGVGRLVSSQIKDCAAAIVDQPPNVQHHMQEMLIDLVSTGLSTLSDTPVDLRRPQAMLLARAKATINAHLRDHRLDRTFLAEQMNMSTRNLSRVFEQDGTSIAAVIRLARLEAIAKDLTDPRLAALSISEVAMKWGMINFQHLSKLFRLTYGTSPRAYRQSMLEHQR